MSSERILDIQSRLNDLRPRIAHLEEMLNEMKLERAALEEEEKRLLLLSKVPDKQGSVSGENGADAPAATNTAEKQSATIVVTAMEAQTQMLNSLTAALRVQSQAAATTSSPGVTPARYDTDESDGNDSEEEKNRVRQLQ